LDKVTRIASPQHDPESANSVDPISYYIELLRPWFQRLWQASLAVFVATLLATKFMMTHWYRAQGLLRPASQEPQSSVSMGALLGSITSSSGSGGMLGNIFGDTASDASELQAIMTSFEFTNEMVKQNHLAPIILAHVTLMQRFLLLLNGGRTTEWKTYLLMQDRFDQNYDDKGGNLTIGFRDPDPRQAKRILDLYISSARARLRARYVQTAQAAIDALERQASKTSDALLVSQLDQLLATQLQQMGTAEIEANFALVVIDAPVVPDRPFSPVPLLDALSAAIFLPLGILVSVVGSDWLQRQSWYDSLWNKRPTPGENRALTRRKNTRDD
jgi:hypothetical protein